MSKDFALLIDYKYCSGCYACEIACKNELGLGLGQHGIKLLEMAPQKFGEGQVDAWDWNYIAVPTGLCNRCEEMKGRAAELDHKVAVFLP